MIDYHGKRVMVLGGLGFIGLNLIRALVKCHAEVTIVSRSQPPMALRWLKDITNGIPITLLRADLREIERYQDHLDKQTVIFNLAGQSGAAKSIIESHNDMQSNVEGNLTLLEGVRKCFSRPRVVFVSSRLVYSAADGQPVAEDHTPSPLSIYGLHKLTVEHYYRLYYQHHSIPYTVMRLTNPYGPYQLPDRRGYGVINFFIMQAVRNEEITIYGDGTQLRDYIYVCDVVDALLSMGCHPNAVGEIFNIGYGQSISLVEAAQIIVSLSESGRVTHIPWPNMDKSVETGDFRCDISHARQTLGWKPLYDWQTGFTESVDTYRRILS
jgi:UDP-glucose 4-epimerase